MLQFTVYHNLYLGVFEKELLWLVITNTMNHLFLIKHKLLTTTKTLEMNNLDTV